MKRFWKDAAAVPGSGGWTVELDGRPVRTPARALLAVPYAPLARAIASEWQQAGDKVDPRAMPMTGLANAALDHVAADAESFSVGLAKYGETDLFAYRADHPEGLVARQEALWYPLLAWARRRYDVDFAVTQGVNFVPQPPATVARLAHAVTSLDPFQVAGLSPLVTIGGSLIAGLAVLEQALSAADAWAAVSVDEAWQLEKWGSDAEAKDAMENRRREFVSAARFLELVRS